MFYHLTVIYTCWLVCLKFLLREMQAFCHMVQPCNGTISIVHEGRASTSPSWVSFVTHINGYLDHMHCRGCLVFNCWGCGSSFVILFAPWYLAEHRESIWSISLKFDAVCFWNMKCHAHNICYCTIQCRRTCLLSFPRRVFVPWLAGTFICDYLQPSETVEVCSCGLLGKIHQTLQLNIFILKAFIN